MTPAKHLPASAPTVPAPQAGEAHLWRADLDAVTPDIGVLDAREAARMARFLSPVHARRFAAGRTVLRSTLSRYLDIAPGAIRFSYGEHGRPGILAIPFDFNLSHTEAEFVLAVAGDRVGVDVERRTREADLPGLARQVMTVDECAAFARLSADAARQAFYALWTRKEAVMKLLGTGFSRNPRTLALGWDGAAWREGDLEVGLHDLALGSDLAAALATTGPAVEVAWKE